MSRRADNNMVKVDGELDLGFTSYWDKDKHGQIVSATQHEEGDVSLDTIPGEVDMEELSERDKAIFMAAALNLEKSSYEIADMFDDVGASTVRYVLREKAPEWYENVFKANGRSIEFGDQRNTNKSSVEEVVSFVEDEGYVLNTDVEEEFDISDAYANTLLRRGEEEGYLQSETGVPGYHNRTKVYFLADDEETRSELVSDTITEREVVVQQDTGQETPQDTPQESYADSEDEGVVLDETDVTEIRVLCEFVRESEVSDANALAEFVLERL